MLKFNRGGTITHLEDGWCINYDPQFITKHFLYHYCDSRGEKDYYLIADMLTQQVACHNCHSKPPEYIIGYLQLCRSTQ